MKRLIGKWLLFLGCAATLSVAIGSFFSLPPVISAALAQSAKPDEQARQQAAIISRHIPLNHTITILYLNGIDGGDNYYRVRYLLYPLQFVDYWSWAHPNAGGYVWNTPRFDTAVGLRHTLISHRADYLVAVRHPAMLGLLRVSGAWNYIFRVDQRRLAAGAPLADVLTQVVRWR